MSIHFVNIYIVKVHDLHRKNILLVAFTFKSSRIFENFELQNVDSFAVLFKTFKRVQTISVHHFEIVEK